MSRHAQAAQRARRPPPLDYTGRRHARITKSMKNLPPSVLCILTELRYRIEDGQTLPISIATLAQYTGQCKSYVSVAVRWLAGEAIPYYGQFTHPPRHIFIERRPRSDGGAGYEITMLPPPELRPRPGASSHKARATISPTARPDGAAQRAQPPFIGVHEHEPALHRPESAPERAETPQNGVHGHEHLFFLVHTENESTNQESTPNEIEPGGGTPRAIEEAPPVPAVNTSAAPPALHTIPPACDENHQDQLAPELIAGHQALNRDRAIFPGEWWELLALQAAHGTEQLLIWQARAAGRAAGEPSRIMPGYYRACAARAAVDAYRPWRGEVIPAPERVPAPNVALSAPVPASPPTLAPRPLLDPACDALLVTMGIRERQALAGVPPALIEQWAAIIDHAGLAVRFDEPLAFAHAQLLRGNAPPSRAELDRWAERARSRAAGTPLPALTDDQIAAIEARKEAIETRAAAIAPPDITCDEHLALLADLECGLTESEALDHLHKGRAATTAPPQIPEAICAALLEGLRQPLHRRNWPLIERIRLGVVGDELRIVCTHVGQIGTVEAEIAPHIRYALRSYAWQPSVRVVAQAPPVAPPPPEPAPPAWIAPERWVTLPGLLRTMLLGSTVEDGTLRCASPSLTTQAHSRYGDLLAALLLEGRQETDNAAI